MELDKLEMLTRPYSPALQGSLGNAPPRVGSPDLYSLIPYPEDYQARAESRRCFILNESQCQVAWTDVDAGGQVTARTFSSLAELRGYRSLHSQQGNSVRILSIHQRHSWRPLGVTRDTFDEIVDIAGASSDLLELPLSFFQKSNAVEEDFSIAPLFRLNADSLEIIYILKYAFKKTPDEEGRDPWVLRQTGVYQKYEFATKSSTWVFLHPTAECQFRSRLIRFLQSPDQRACLHRNPLLIHSILFGTFVPVWRDYLMHLEGRMLPIANTAMTAELDKALRVDHESLTAVRGTENRCVALPPIFRSLDKTFNLLHQANKAFSDSGVTQQYELQAMNQLLNNYAAAVNSYGQAAWSLQGRAARSAAHITDTLSFKDAYIAKRQTEFMLRDSTTVRVITVVTLIYLPSTFTATVLGMNSFFGMDHNNNIVASRQFWIYVAIAVPLTVATLCYWWYFQKSKKRRELSTNASMV